MQSSSLNPHEGEVTWRTKDPTQAEKRSEGRDKWWHKVLDGNRDSSISSRLNEFSKGNRFLVYDYSLVCVCVCVCAFCIQRLHFLGLFSSHLALSRLCPAKSFPFLAERSSSCLEGINKKEMLSVMETACCTTLFFLAGRIMET